MFREAGPGAGFRVLAVLAAGFSVPLEVFSPVWVVLAVLAVLAARRIGVFDLAPGPGSPVLGLSRKAAAVLCLPSSSLRASSHRLLTARPLKFSANAYKVDCQNRQNYKRLQLQAWGQSLNSGCRSICSDGRPAPEGLTVTRLTQPCSSRMSTISRSSSAVVMPCQPFLQISRVFMPWPTSPASI